MNRRLEWTQAWRQSGFSVIELLVVVALFGIVAAIAIPASSPAVGGYRLSGAAHAISYEISLAKMRAAAGFTRARLQVDLSGGTYQLQSWNRDTNAWTTEGGTERLPRGVWFGFATVASPPPDTQGSIAQASACLSDGATWAAINGWPYAPPAGGTACVQFNSRGIPVDATGAPTGAGAIYLTDGRTVYGTTVSATGMAQLWLTPTLATAWQRQ
jgi:prepilin-type N-terminal cleavage/methylation domain-containing protein